MVDDYKNLTEELKLEPQQPQPATTPWSAWGLNKWDAYMALCGAALITVWFVHEPMAPFHNPYWAKDPFMRAKYFFLATVAVGSFLGLIFCFARSIIENHPNSRRVVIGTFIGAPLLYLLYLALAMNGKI